ncbi:MAG: DUF302 domain-containing protein [Nanoarchaeota archaeon]|nr:DUF302 domain-containing protein [Nanoarchaeota archaeon]MBU1051717.1 DUF302 domain-containing protein [Nanoarchaeota archaeon]MBU1988935.1 DUF302 domain-containing protein [Nanoarchaeota archaeon]
MGYGFSRKVDLEFTEAVENVKAALKKEGFGVLTEINVKETLKKKLDVDYDNYLILGACNPPLAHKALESEKNIGLLLPCNVIVYSQNGETIVSAVNPMEAMSMVKNEKLQCVAKEVSEKLKRVVDNLGGKK